MAFRDLLEGDVTSFIAFLKVGDHRLHSLLACTLIDMLESEHPVYRLELEGVTRARAETITPMALQKKQARSEAVRLALLDAGFMKHGFQARAHYKVSKQFDKMSPATQRRIWDAGKNHARHLHAVHERTKEARKLFSSNSDGSITEEMQDYIWNPPKNWAPKVKWNYKREYPFWIRNPNYRRPFLTSSE